MKQKCGMSGCNCEAQADGYCSDACRNGNSRDGQCGCQHPGCK